jgi:glycosyltransferase involved in cell wall biosynthesis
LPTVAFDTSVAREYLGAHGVYAERGSADSLAAKLVLLLDDEGRQQIGQAPTQAGDGAVQLATCRAPSSMCMPK